MIFRKRTIPDEEIMTLKEQRSMLGDQLNFAAAEAYKLLRANLTFSLPDEQKCRVVGVTSAVRGEGKSTTSINLAYTLAETGKRVLLVEADMRRPQLAHRLAIDAAPGLSNLLAGLCREKDVVQDVGLLENMKVITSGDVPPNPSELLGSERMSTVVETLAQSFDFIIFDLPPVNAVSDGLVVSRFIQGMIVVVRQDYSDRQGLSAALRQLEYMHIKVLGFVMTHSSISGGRYGRYGRYAAMAAMASTAAMKARAGKPGRTRSGREKPAPQNPERVSDDRFSFSYPAGHGRRQPDGGREPDATGDASGAGRGYRGGNAALLRPGKLPEVFLRRRREAWERLNARLTPGGPQVLLGAEVRYYRGISRLEELHRLCLSGTHVLLLEMPFSPWSSGILEELEDLLLREDITVVLAHIERYLPDQPHELWLRLRHMGALFQCNASFFLDWRTRRRAIRMLRGGDIHLLGSDCHGVSHRPPQMEQAMAYIRRPCRG